MTIIKKEAIILSQEEIIAFEKVLDICSQIECEANSFELITLAKDICCKINDLWDTGGFEE